jgi:uncharacterized LabA/DUF88 family protein
MSSFFKVGVFVDNENIRRNGGFGMRYEILRNFACRGNAEPIRLNAYVSFDKRRAERDAEYSNNINKFFSSIRDNGFKVIEKEVKWYTNEDGTEFGKANADLDMAVDALLQSENLERVILATGDGDFVQVVRALQNKGCRVEVISFDNVSQDLRRECDMFMSGYLIPDLLPVKDRRDRSQWGEVGSRVRGTCYFYKQDDNFGFMKFQKQIGEICIMDSREKESPYNTIYFNKAAFQTNFDLSELPSRNYIFEFTIKEKSIRGETKQVADDIELLYKYSNL